MQLRLAAREIFDHALCAVDAGEALKNAIRFEHLTLRVGETQFDLGTDSGIYCIAVGKAARAMAAALDEVLGRRLVAGLIAAPAGKQKLADRWQCFEGGHPLPNDQSLAAASVAFALLNRANDERALVIFLVSGGGSAMIEWPINDEITLSDLQTTNRILVTSGASISEINAVRRAFSFIKGGRLAAKAPNCDQITLIISDVLSGEEWNVASGPTMPPPSGTPNARDVIERYHLRSQLPAPILRAIDSDDETTPSNTSASLRKHFVLLDNHIAVEAAANAARTRGFITEIARDIADGRIEVGCDQLLARLDELQRQNANRSVCVISGGEFACPVRGDGIGGRNAETALRLAIAAEEKRDEIGEFVTLCAGTDGIDGNSPAAGAIIDSTTIERSRKMGLDAGDFLNRSDSYSFLAALGEAIETGPTGTNVRDLRILLSSPHSAE